jgi:hypothetical protein
MGVAVACVAGDRVSLNGFDRTTSQQAILQFRMIRQSMFRDGAKRPLRASRVIARFVDSRIKKTKREPFFQTVPAQG